MKIIGALLIQTCIALSFMRIIPGSKGKGEYLGIYIYIYTLLDIYIYTHTHTVSEEWF